MCSLTQKEQLQIMSDFRSGISNVLVATSIGEEGLDVGEVELIVCFDICSSNPTRFVQRIGRTGRQKRGYVVMLVTEGREQQLLKEVLAQKDQLNRKLLTSSLIKRSLYEHAPRLVPPQFNPKCEQRFMEPAPPAASTPKAKTASPLKGKGRKLPSTVKCHDLRNFFKQSQEKFLQGAPSYKASEATQQMLQKEMARHSVQHFLLDTQQQQQAQQKEPQQVQPTISCSTISSSQEETQRWRKLTRLLQASKPLISDSQRNQDLFAQLQDKQLPQPLKLFLLQSDASFVRDLHAKMQQQQELQLPEKRLNTRQQRTRRIYELVQQICGEQLEQLLQPAEPVAELTMRDLLQPQDVQRHKQFNAVCGDIFKDLHEGGLCADNYELVQQQLEQLELRRLEQTMREQLGNESSGYFEQWEEPEESTTMTLQLSQWQNSSAVQHSSTPVKQQDTSRLECSQLSVNLSRLNCVISAASTPILERKVQTLRESSLMDALDEDMSAFHQLEEQQEKQQKKQQLEQQKELQLEQPTVPVPADITTMSTKSMTATPMSTPDALEQALDIDLNDFLEPLPEEEQLQQLSGAKENNPPTVPSTASTPRNLSPDLFADDSVSPWHPATTTTTAAAVPAKSLAAKLAAKSILRSPEGRQRSAPVSAEKSPSIFENYLQRMRGRGQLSRAAQRLHYTSSNQKVQEQREQPAAKQEQPVVKQEQQEEDSPIMRRRSSKRKIVEISDDEEEDEQQQQMEEMDMIPATQLLLDDSFEQVPATQAVSR